MNINTKSRIAFYSSYPDMITIVSLIYPNTSKVIFVLSKVSFEEDVFIKPFLLGLNGDYTWIKQR